MQNAVKSPALKMAAIDTFLDEKVKAILDGLSPEAIEKRAKETNPKELTGKLREELTALTAAFNAPAMAAVDGCYNHILTFAQFVGFDFFSLLKKFDSSLTERNFNRSPQFTAIKGDQVVRPIQNFLEAAGGLDPDIDWKTVQKVLKSYKNMDVVAADQWNKLLVQWREVKRSNILELMVRHITATPLWQPKMTVLPNEHIAEPYLENFKVSTAAAIESIVNAKRNAKVRELAKAVFGSADTNRLRYYTAQNHEIYVKKNFEGFTHVMGLNLLKAFLSDCFQKDIQEICDLLLIRGQWSSNGLSRQLSEGFHDIKAMIDQVAAFDDALADNGQNGARLKAALIRSDRDKSQAKYIRIILGSVNEEAENLIRTAAQGLIVIGKNFKSVLEDMQKKSHELIINWKELESASNEPVGPKITMVYKKMYCFIQILQLLVQSNEDVEAAS
ncbi:MAG: DUF5312 domain-containing protein [Treponema sp.]|nr:DUF5312 domain-containing protein [Treponema sp.]